MSNKSIYDRNRTFNTEMKRSINYYSTCLHCEKCGHSLQVIRRNKAFCEWCGRYIFKNKKDEFEYRLKERLK